MPAERILLLGGTREAAELAERLVAEGHDVTVSLAGRTREPRPTAGRLRIGGFGGSEGLAGWLRREKTQRLIDATHPFAEVISRNAAEAARATGIAFERVERPPWTAQAGDRWEPVPDIAAAVDAIGPGERVLLALGAQHIAPFARRSDAIFFVRTVDAIELPSPDWIAIVGRPSNDPAREADMLRRHAVDRIVCRNSGGAGAYAKIEAAQMLRLPVTMIARPAAPEA